MTDAVDTKPAEAVADYGNDFAPSPAAPMEVELTAEELDKLGIKAGEEKTDDEPKEDDKKAAPKAEEAKEEEKPRDNKGQFIPKSRFDAVNEKAKAKVASLEAKIQAMAERLAPLDGVAPDVKAIEATLDAKGDEYGKLLADGELEKANGVLREINKLNRQLGAIEAGALASTHAQESTQVDALGQLIEMYKDEYPVFDDGDKEFYDQSIVNFVADLQGRFEMTGMTPAEALRQSVELAVAKFRLDEGEPAEVAKPNKGEERKAAAVAKALKASAAQPAKSDKTGLDSDKVGLSKIDVSALSPEQFAALPESTLARLRGDYV